MSCLSKCPVRSYHASSQAFLDLVEDPTAHTTQLKLRAGARHALPASAIPPGSPAYDTRLPHTERIKHLYKHAGANEIVFWPPITQEGTDSGALALLGTRMNPPSHVSNVQGTGDERSLVYSTGSNADGVQALVLLGFDPAIQLQGIQEWDSNYEQEWRDGATRKQEEEDKGPEAGVFAKRNMQVMHLKIDVCREPFPEADEIEEKGKHVALLEQLAQVAL